MKKIAALFLATSIALTGCATTSSTLSDEERCARFSGYWVAWGVCRSAN